MIVRPVSRLGLIGCAVLTVAWIVVSLVLLPGWSVNGLLHNLAVWVDIPLAVWLGGLAFAAYRDRARSRED